MHIGARKPREHLDPHVRPAVAVGVFHVPHVGSRTDEHTRPVAQHSRGPGKPGGEHHAGFIESVPVPIFQATHLAQVLLALFAVADHADHVHPPAVVKIHRHRIDHLRLAGDQLHFEPGQRAEGFQRFLGTFGRDARQEPAKVRLGVKRHLFLFDQVLGPDRPRHVPQTNHSQNQQTDAVLHAGFPPQVKFPQVFG